MVSLTNSMYNMKLKWQNEDELPENLSDEVYKVMYPTSIVNGVRYFPYMELIDGSKWYLINLGE